MPVRKKRKIDDATNHKIKMVICTKCQQFSKNVFDCHKHIICTEDSNSTTFSDQNGQNLFKFKVQNAKVNR